MTAEAILSLRDVRVRYPVRKGPFGRATSYTQVLDRISLDLREGEVLGLIGESGSGKSTLGRVMLGLLHPDAGQVLYRGDDIWTMPKPRRAGFRRAAQLIFQDPLSALDPTMRIGDIVTEPLRIQQGLRGAEARRRAAALLEEVSLPAQFAQRRPAELSGGQRQRVVIARALSVKPDFVVADEPVSALDVSIQAQILELLRVLRQSMALTLLFISHDIAVVRYVADRIAVMYRGEIVEIGPAAQVVTNPRHAYTRALLASAPELAAATKPPIAI